MTIRWERFAGSTDNFAVRLSFMPDPHPSVAVDDDEGQSWGALQIWVDGQNLCSHIDQGEVLQSAHWYLLPFLEWISVVWNPMLHEERLPNRNLAPTAVEALALTRSAPALAEEPEILAWEEEWFEWRNRHALRAARSGGLLPNVVFRRMRDWIEVSWQEEPIAGASPGFGFSSAAGVALLAPGEVASILYDIASAAAEYLSKLNPASERIAALVESLVELRLLRNGVDRSHWLASSHCLGPLDRRLQSRTFDEDAQAAWSKIVLSLEGSDDRAASEAALALDETQLVVTGASQAALLFGSVAPTVTEADVRVLTGMLLEQFDPAAIEGLELKKLTRHVPLDSSAPAWEQGYELAEELYEEIANGEEWVDIERFLGRLGVDLTSITLDDPSIRACSIVGPRYRTVTAINLASPYSESPTAKRFTLAHELAHLLFDRAHGQRLSIASGPWAPRGIEQRANAFAAMLLMPTVLVQQALADLPDPISDLAGLTAFANRLKVSRQAAIGHLYNLTLMSEDARDELLRVVARRADME